jgi:hypothetical protein
VLICSERKVLLADRWFVVREKYYWLVADKPNKQGGGFASVIHVERLKYLQRTDAI